MMLKNECSCMLSKVLSLIPYVFLSNNCSNGGWMFKQLKIKGHKPPLMWTWIGSGLQLLALITPIKIGQPSCKNLNVMIKLTSP
jgi:hypothetical protein